MFVYVGIFIVLVSIGFWLDVRIFIMFIIYNIGNYGRYFVDIYNNVIWYVLMWIFFFVFVGVYLVVYFLGRLEWYGYVFLILVMGIVFFVIFIFLWNIGVKKYRGVGN